MNTTPNRVDAKGIKMQIAQLESDINHLKQVDGISSSVIAERENVIEQLKTRYSEKLKKASLEDIRIYQTKQKVKRPGGEKIYDQWQASWRVKGRVKTVYLGRVGRINESDARRLARRIKAASLGLIDHLPETRGTTKSKKQIVEQKKITITNMVLPRKQEIGRGIVGE